jgi:hypothetical protein
MNQSECKLYFAGFTHTVALIYSMDSTTNGVCGDTSDLVYEFVNEVRKNKKARESETHMVLFALLARDHSCGNIKDRIKNGISAGSLIDMCHAGDLGFYTCSQYQEGFISALLFLSEQTGEPILCGDQRLINSVSVSGILNSRLQENFRLRRDSAVVVMLHELMEKMPCPSK